jgi:hypothetical protein
MFCSGAIERTFGAVERTAAGRSSAKPKQPRRRRCVYFLFCSFALLAIKRTNLCDRALYQTASTSICEFFFLFLVFIFSCYFNFFLFLFTCGEALQHPMDHVHIAVTLITMLEIVPQQDSFLTILMGI